MSAFQLAFLNLTRKWMSTTIAVFGIAASIACSGILYRIGYLNDLKLQLLMPSSEVIIGAKASDTEVINTLLADSMALPDPIPYRLYQTLMNEKSMAFADGVSHDYSFIHTMTPILLFGKYKSYRVMGTDDSFFARAKGRGIGFAEGSWRDKEQAVAVGNQVATKEGLSVGDEIEVSAWTENIDSYYHKKKLMVTAILERQNNYLDRQIIAPIHVGQNLIQEAGFKSPWGSEVLHYLFVEMNEKGLLILKELINQRSIAQITEVSRAKLKLQSTAERENEIGFLVSVVIIALSTLTLLGVLTQRFESMMDQIAVVRAIGYSRFFIFRWLSSEALILGIFACCLGALVEIFVFPSVYSILARDALQVQISPLLSWKVWLVGFLVTTLSVVFPMIRFLKVNTHEQLRV